MKFLLLRHPENWKRALHGPSPNLISIYPPLGLLYIGASLEQDGHNVEIIDFGAETVSKEQLENSLTTSDAVGISICTNNYEKAADTAREIKEIDPEIPLIIGGPHCTFLKKRSLSDVPDADIAVELEGEIVILDLVKFIQGRKKLSDIHGIYYRSNNRIKSGKPYRIIEDLDSLPFPARHLVEKYDYGNFPERRRPKKKFTNMITSRGCPHRCRFCARYSNVKKNYCFRARSAKNVIEEIQEINDKYGSVVIVDDNFLADIKRAHEIFDGLLEIGSSIDLSIVGIRIDSTDRALFKKMKKANVKSISFGIESGNQDVLDFYNKRITLEQIREAVQLGREMNFTTQGTLIFGAPIETKEHIENTIKFVCSLPLDLAVFRPLYYEMGSDLWIDAVKNKKISKDEFTVTADSRRDLGNFTPAELNKYIKKAFRRFYLRPSYIFGQINRALLHNDINQLKNVWGFALSIRWNNIL